MDSQLAHMEHENWSRGFIHTHHGSAGDENSRHGPTPVHPGSWHGEISGAEGKYALPLRI